MESTCSTSTTSTNTYNPTRQEKLLVPTFIEQQLMNVPYDGIMMIPYKYGNTFEMVMQLTTLTMMMDKRTFFQHSDYSHVPTVIRNHLAGNPTVLTRRSVNKLIDDFGIIISDDNEDRMMYENRNESSLFDQASQMTDLSNINDLSTSPLDLDTQDRKSSLKNNTDEELSWNEMIENEGKILDDDVDYDNHSLKDNKSDDDNDESHKIKNADEKIIEGINSMDKDNENDVNLKIEKKVNDLRENKIIRTRTFGTAGLNTYRKQVESKYGHGIFRSTLLEHDNDIRKKDNDNGRDNEPIYSEGASNYDYHQSFPILNSKTLSDNSSKSKINDDKRYNLDNDDNDFDTSFKTYKSKRNMTDQVPIENIKHTLSIGSIPVFRNKVINVVSPSHKNNNIIIYKSKEIHEMRKSNRMDGRVIAYAVSEYNGEPTNICYLTMAYAKGKNNEPSAIQISIVGDRTIMLNLRVKGMLFGINRVNLITKMMSSNHFTFGNYHGELAGINFGYISKDTEVCGMQNSLRAIMKHQGLTDIIECAIDEFSTLMGLHLRGSRTYTNRVSMSVFKRLRPAEKDYDRIKYFNNTGFVEDKQSEEYQCLQVNLEKFDERKGCMYGALVQSGEYRSLISPCGREYSDFNEYIKDPCTIRAKAFGIKIMDIRDQISKNMDNNKMIQSHVCVDCGRMYDEEIDRKLCEFYCIGVTNRIENGTMKISNKSPYGRY